jgi:hypothetical protein
MFKKILLACLGLFVIALIVGVLFGAKILNSSIKTGVEKIGPKVTQTSVTLESVDLSIFSGAGTIKGLNVGNPTGFKSENIFALGQIDVAIDIGSLLSDTIIIDKIIIKDPAISYETRLSTSNVKQLLANIEAFTGPADTTAEDPTEVKAGPSKKIVIKQVVVEGATVFVGVLGVGQKVPLPRIELTDLGEDRDLTIAQAIDIVLKEVTKAIGPAISGAGVMLKDGGKALLDGALTGDDSAMKKAGESLKGATDGIKGLFGK